MKKVEEEKQRVVVEKVVTYVATDGTVFNNEAECRLYEDSARCVCLSRIKAMAIGKEFSEFDLYNAGSEEYHLYALAPKTKEDIDTINQCAYLVNNHENQAVTDEAIGDIVIITFDYDMDCCWLETQTGIINRLHKYLSANTEKSE